MRSKRRKVSLAEMLKEEQWTELFDTIYRRKNQIKSDSLLQEILDSTIEIMVEKSKNKETETNFLNGLNQLNLLHKARYITISAEDLEIIYVGLANGKRKNIDLAYRYAKEFPDNTFMKGIIYEYEIQDEKKQLLLKDSLRNNTPQAKKNTSSKVTTSPPSKNIASDNVNLKMKILKAMNEAILVYIDSPDIYATIEEQKSEEKSAFLKAIKNL
ncbi:hypothetical protein ACG2LH_14365 [Zhouia sp. PK063]|uniref:hypothetical protein n=1 Tax=Zhouia sp. PK063 TaxID=3373602 RepID=UPI0037956FA0